MPIRRRLTAALAVGLAVPALALAGGCGSDDGTDVRNVGPETSTDAPGAGSGSPGGTGTPTGGTTSGATPTGTQSVP